jgi:hypothetical protein
MARIAPWDLLEGRLGVEDLPDRFEVREVVGGDAQETSRNERSRGGPDERGREEPPLGVPLLRPGVREEDVERRERRFRDALEDERFPVEAREADVRQAHPVGARLRDPRVLDLDFRPQEAGARASGGLVGEEAATPAADLDLDGTRAAEKDRPVDGRGGPGGLAREGDPRRRGNARGGDEFLRGGGEPGALERPADGGAAQSSTALSIFTTRSPTSPRIRAWQPSLTPGPMSYASSSGSIGERFCGFTTHSTRQVEQVPAPPQIEEMRAPSR